jgi:hypothetical protein
MNKARSQTVLYKTLSVAIVTLLCCGLGLAFQQTAEWSNLDFVEGRFSVSMPSKPEATSTVVDTAVGKLPLYTFGSASKVALLMVSYADYPNEPSDAAQNEKVLDGVRDGLLKGLEAEMLIETRITLQGHPGREWRAIRTAGDVDVVFSWKVYLVGRRLYQMGAATTKADAEAADVQRFFNSFQLTGVVPPQETAEPPRSAKVAE